VFTLTLIVIGRGAVFSLLAVLTSLVASGQLGRSLTRRSSALPPPRSFDDL